MGENILAILSNPIVQMFILIGLVSHIMKKVA